MLALSLGVFFPVDDFLLVHTVASENTLTILITAFGYFYFNFFWMIRFLIFGLPLLYLVVN